MSESSHKSLAGLAAALGVIACLLAPTAAGATTYEPEPAFCQQTIVQDYLAPLTQLPRLRQPLADGRLGFTSATVYLKPSKQLVVGDGKIGYRLSSRLDGPIIHPGWRVTSTLARVGWRGQAIQRLGRVTKAVSSLGSGIGSRVQFEAGPPAPYRLTVVFRSAAGRRLARYGFYFRVVKEVDRVRLALDASGVPAPAYRAEETVFSQLQNLGTVSFSYGLGYRIEQRGGRGWFEAPESPRDPVPAIALTLGPGRASQCSGFWIPPTMAPGTYRIVRGTLASEFMVTP